MQIATVHSALGFVDYLFRASCLRGTGCLRAGGICLGLLPTNGHFASWTVAANVFESLLWKWKSFQGDADPLVLPPQSQQQQLTAPPALSENPSCTVPCSCGTPSSSGHGGFYSESTKG